MRESRIELALRSRVVSLGGLCDKFKSPGRRFVPDDIVTWDDTIDFVECKTEGGRLSPGQQRDHARRRALGQYVFVIWTLPGVEWYVSHAVDAKAHSDPSDRFHARESAVRYLGRDGNGQDLGCIASGPLIATLNRGKWAYTRNWAFKGGPRRVAGGGE